MAGGATGKGNRDADWTAGNKAGAKIVTETGKEVKESPVLSWRKQEEVRELSTLPPLFVLTKTYFQGMQTNGAKWLTFLLLAAAVNAAAQTDSLAFAQARWTVQPLAKGIEWKTVYFEKGSLFGAAENINLIEISPKQKGYKLHVVHSDSLEPTSVLAMRSRALAAVNGSFFKMRGLDPDESKKVAGKAPLERSLLGYNRSVVYLREGDSVIAENKEKDNARKRHNQGSVVIRKRAVSLVKDSADINWEHQLRGEDVMSTGPVLIVNGQDQLLTKDAFTTDRHPRTAIGKRRDGTLVLLVVDGRAAESAGASLPELQAVFRWLRCTEAINLDGGGSTTMYIKGQPFNGVVNYPTDNKKWDHEGEREVANALVIVAR
ncbi:phosphodiester glycosidase family protein [Flavisolibacter ginsenosidimutans]